MEQPDDAPEAEQGDPVDLSPMNAAERSIDALLAEAHLAAAYELPGLLARHADALGGGDALVYLVDLQQRVLVPFLGSSGPRPSQLVDALGVESTVAGRCFQHLEVMTQDATGAGVRVWLPLLDGTERLGVLAVTVADPAALEHGGGLLRRRLWRFASIAAELIMTKTLYGDILVALRRRSKMGLAAELQWSLLPPLTFACRQVTIAGALEPAYQVAGDSLDYAVDAGYARFAVFDGMGHGLQSAQLAVLAIAAYRNSRRGGQTLTETAVSVDQAVTAAFTGDAFTTAVLAELNTHTGVLRWVNAGHPDPLLLRGGRMVKSLHIEPGLPFGLRRGFGDAALQPVAASEQLQRGDTVVIYTDGITEARSPEGEFFGVQRLVDLLGRSLAADLPAPETMRRVVRSLLDHQQGQLDDDASILLAEWCGGEERKLLP